MSGIINVHWDSYHALAEPIEKVPGTTVYKVRFFMNGKVKGCLGSGLVYGNGYRGWKAARIKRRFNGEVYEEFMEETDICSRLLREAVTELGKLTLCKDVTKPRPILTLRIKYKLGPELPPIIDLSNVPID
jgi:hypothetical protein